MPRKNGNSDKPMSIQKFVKSRALRHERAEREELLGTVIPNTRNLARDILLEDVPSPYVELPEVPDYSHDAPDSWEEDDDESIVIDNPNDNSDDDDDDKSVDIPSHPTNIVSFPRRSSQNPDSDGGSNPNSNVSSNTVRYLPFQPARYAPLPAILSYDEAGLESPENIASQMERRESIRSWSRIEVVEKVAEKDQIKFEVSKCDNPSNYRRHFNLRDETFDFTDEEVHLNKDDKVPSKTLDTFVPISNNLLLWVVFYLGIENKILEPDVKVYRSMFETISQYSGYYFKVRDFPAFMKWAFNLPLMWGIRLPNSDQDNRDHFVTRFIERMTENMYRHGHKESRDIFICSLQKLGTMVRKLINVKVIAQERKKIPTNNLVSAALLYLYNFPKEKGNNTEIKPNFSFNRNTLIVDKSKVTYLNNITLNLQELDSTKNNLFNNTLGDLNLPYFFTSIVDRLGIVSDEIMNRIFTIETRWNRPAGPKTPNPNPTPTRNTFHPFFSMVTIDNRNQIIFNTMGNNLSDEERKLAYMRYGGTSRIINLIMNEISGEYSFFFRKSYIITPLIETWNRLVEIVQHLEGNDNAKRQEELNWICNYDSFVHSEFTDPVEWAHESIYLMLKELFIDFIRYEDTYNFLCKCFVAYDNNNATPAPATAATAAATATPPPPPPPPSSKSTGIKKLSCGNCKNLHRFVTYFSLLSCIENAFSIIVFFALLRKKNDRFFNDFNRREKKANESSNLSDLELVRSGFIIDKVARATFCGLSHNHFLNRHVKENLGISLTFDQIENILTKMTFAMGFEYVRNEKNPIIQNRKALVEKYVYRDLPRNYFNRETFIANNSKWI